MIKSILTGVAACAMLASPAALAQSLGNDGEAAAGAEQVKADHSQAVPINALEVQVPEAVLDRLSGRYTAQDKSVIVVTRVGSRLAADLAGMRMEFSPSGPNEFFIHGSPLTLSFAQGEAGMAQALTVRENGMVIMQATATR